MNGEMYEWRAYARELEATVRKLRTELTTAREEGRADKARLDWLNENGRCAKFSTGWQSWDVRKSGDTFVHTDVREAIDMAMEPKWAIEKT